MNTLLSLFQTIQLHSHKLLDCLNLEKQALDNDDFEQLNTLANQKQSLLDELHQLDQQRSTHTPDKDFNQYIANSQNQSLIKQWEITRKDIAACKQQNEINGRLIAKRSNINQDILSILTGQDQAKDETYNAQGNQTNKSSLLGNVKA